MSVFDRLFSKKVESVEVSEIEGLEIQLAEAKKVLFTAEDAVDSIGDDANGRYARHKQTALRSAQREVNAINDKLGRAHIKNSERIIMEKDAKRYATERKAEIRCKTELNDLKNAMRDVLSDGDYEMVMNRMRVM